MDLPFQPFGYGVVIGGQIRQVFGAMGAVQFTFDFFVPSHRAAGNGAFDLPGRR